jgi:hypothetical protein
MRIYVLQAAKITLFEHFKASERKRVEWKKKEGYEET